MYILMEAEMLLLAEALVAVAIVDDAVGGAMHFPFTMKGISQK